MPAMSRSLRLYTVRKRMSMLLSRERCFTDYERKFDNVAYPLAGAQLFFTRAAAKSVVM